jgi:hypothetical protein
MHFFDFLFLAHLQKRKAQLWPSLQSAAAELARAQTQETRLLHNTSAAALKGKALNS